MLWAWTQIIIQMPKLKTVVNIKEIMRTEQ